VVKNGLCGFLKVTVGVFLNDGSPEILGGYVADHLPYHPVAFVFVEERVGNVFANTFAAEFS
jgi:hypothetical protein